jgi:hypothetical protein
LDSSEANVEDLCVECKAPFLRRNPTGRRYRVHKWQGIHGEVLCFECSYLPKYNTKDYKEPESTSTTIELGNQELAAHLIKTKPGFEHHTMMIYALKDYRCPKCIEFGDEYTDSKYSRIKNLQVHTYKRKLGVTYKNIFDHYKLYHYEQKDDKDYHNLVFGLLQQLVVMERTKHIRRNNNSDTRYSDAIFYIMKNYFAPAELMAELLHREAYAVRDEFYRSVENDKNRPTWMTNVMRECGMLKEE